MSEIKQPKMRWKKSYYRAMEALRKSQREAFIRQQTVNRMKSHLVMIDERECSLDAWNSICDALLETNDEQ